MAKARIVPGLAVAARLVAGCGDGTGGPDDAAVEDGHGSEAADVADESSTDVVDVEPEAAAPGRGAEMRIVS